MKVKETGRTRLKEAELRLESAEGALKGKNYAYAFRQAQECVELSLKAALRWVGIEYPKIHDIGDVLEMSSSRFPGWFRPMIRDFCKVSTSLAERRDESMYGNEERGLVPMQLFDQSDAKHAVGSAREVMKACRKLFK